MHAELPTHVLVNRVRNNHRSRATRARAHCSNARGCGIRMHILHAFLRLASRRRRRSRLLALEIRGVASWLMLASGCANSLLACWLAGWLARIWQRQTVEHVLKMYYTRVVACAHLHTSRHVISMDASGASR